MLGDVALDEDRRPGRVKSHSEQLREGQQRALAQNRRIVLHGDGVLIDHAVEGVVGFLKGHPVAQGAQIVADLEGVGGRLDAGEDARGDVDGDLRHGVILAAARPGPPTRSQGPGR